MNIVMDTRNLVKIVIITKRKIVVMGVHVISEISLAGILGEAGDLSGFAHGNSLLCHAGLHISEASSGKPSIGFPSY
jgi:transposase